MVNEMGRCKDCKSWTLKYKVTVGLMALVGRCENGDNGAPDGIGICPFDEDGWLPTLEVNGDFGCVHFEKAKRNG